MQDKLQRALDISRKTGDRVIVFDDIKSENPYVIIGLDDYEKMVIEQNEVRDLTEEGLLDKINRDIAIWKSENKNELISKEIQNDKLVKEEDDVNVFNKDFSNEEDDNMYYYDEPDISPLDMLKKETENFENKNNKKSWNIPSDIKESAEF